MHATLSAAFFQYFFLADFDFCHCFCFAAHEPLLQNFLFYFFWFWIDFFHFAFITQNIEELLSYNNNSHKN